MPASERVKRSVRMLTDLYSIVVGMALVTAIGNMFVRSAVGESSIQWERLIWFSAFFITMLPFYHGALRYLDETYALCETAPKKLFLVIDYLLLMSEACLIVVLALAISNPTTFVTIFFVLLLVDIIWAIASYFATDAGNKTTTLWLVINFVAAVIWLILRFTPTLKDISPYDFVGLAWLRSIVDYALCWKVFIPD